MLVVNVLLGDRFLNFSMNFADDGAEIVLELQLQFLVVTAALVRRPLLEDLRKTVEDLCLAATLFWEEIGIIINHELQVDLIFLVVPLSNCDFALIRLESHFLNLVILWLKALLIWFLNVFRLSLECPGLFWPPCGALVCWDAQFHHVDWIWLRYWKFIIIINSNSPPIRSSWSTFSPLLHPQSPGTSTQPPNYHLPVFFNSVRS